CQDRCDCGISGTLQAFIVHQAALAYVAGNSRHDRASHEVFESFVTRDLHDGALVVKKVASEVSPGEVFGEHKVMNAWVENHPGAHFIGIMREQRTLAARS